MNKIIFLLTFLMILSFFKVNVDCFCGGCGCNMFGCNCDWTPSQCRGRLAVPQNQTPVISNQTAEQIFDSMDINKDYKLDKHEVLNEILKKRHVYIDNIIKTMDKNNNGHIEPNELDSSLGK